MQQLNYIFKLTTLLALLGWIIIMMAPGWRHTNQAVSSGVVSLLAVIYVYLLIGARSLDTEPVRGSFASLGGIIRLFKSPRVIVAGWVHFLAFDLMAGLWIRNDAATVHISHGWLIPVYLLTLMFGPAGLLLYFLLKALMA